MLPLIDAGTIAAFAVMLASDAFNVDTLGCGAPAGHSDRKPSGAGGTTVAFNEYAFTVDGTPHPLLSIGTSRLCAAPMIGPPKMPAALRVSMTRQGFSE